MKTNKLTELVLFAKNLYFIFPTKRVSQILKEITNFFLWL